MSEDKKGNLRGAEVASSGNGSDPATGNNNYTPFPSNDAQITSFDIAKAFEIVQGTMPNDELKKELESIKVRSTTINLKAQPRSFGDPLPVPGGGPIIEDEEELEDIPFLLSAYTPELPSKGKLPDSLLYDLDSAGQWLTDYVDFAKQASPMTPDVFHEVLGLSLLSAAIARRVYFRVSNQNIYPNIYSLIVANSTLYAKTTAFEIAKDVLEKAGLAYLTLPVGITPQSLILELTNKKPERFSDWEQEDQSNWRQERKFAAQRMWLMDEASSLLDAFDQKITADLLTHVLKLYDCPKRLTAASTISRGRETIRWAYLTICGPTTPAAMRSHLANRQRWGDGLFARFIFVTPDRPPIRVFWPPPLEIPEGIYQSLQELALYRLPVRSNAEIEQEKVPEPESIQVELENGVYERWDAYHAALYGLTSSGTVGEKLHSNYMRFHMYAFKIAMQLAAIDWSSSQAEGGIKISLKHWARAQMIVEGYRSSLHRLTEDAKKPDEDENLERKILQRVKAAPNGLTAREIAIALNMSSTTKRNEVEQNLDRMIKDGLLESEERKRSRGPATKIFKPMRKA